MNCHKDVTQLSHNLRIVTLHVGFAIIRGHSMTTHDRSRHIASSDRHAQGDRGDLRNRPSGGVLADSVGGIDTHGSTITDAQIVCPSLPDIDTHQLVGQVET